MVGEGILAFLSGRIKESIREKEGTQVRSFSAEEGGGSVQPEGGD